MNRFDAGQQALIKRMKATAGRTVTYVRGATSVSFTAWVGSTMFALNNPEPGQAAVIHGDRDYLCAVVDYQAVMGAGILPQKGDRIQDLDGTGATITYELQTPTGEPVWRYSDQTRQVFRLHCKRVSP